MIISGTVDTLSALSRLSTHSYSEAAYIANKTVEYANKLANKQISKPEFDDLMADLKIDELVASTADEQNMKSSLISMVSDLTAVLSVAFPML